VDGTPRNIPIILTWNGAEIVMCTPTNAPKLESFRGRGPDACAVHCPGPPVAGGCHSRCPVPVRAPADAASRGTQGVGCRTAARRHRLA
jgi:hypothetical protein